MGLKAWHVYALIVPLVAILFIGVTYGSSERDGTDRTVENAGARQEDEPGGGPDGGGPPPDGSPPPGGGGPGGVVVVAQNIAFEPTNLTVPAGQEFTLTLDNQDPSILHHVAIDDVFEGELFAGVATMDYTIPALDAGEYEFICSVHPIQMVGTITAE